MSEIRPVLSDDHFLELAKKLERLPPAELIKRLVHDCVVAGIEFALTHDVDDMLDRRAELADEIADQVDSTIGELMDEGVMWMPDALIYKRLASFTWEDVDLLRDEYESEYSGTNVPAGQHLLDLADRIESLLPPRETPHP
jgi:uncharacterized hydantoinase/oxoprolinase family protein